jgi:hypothetical protein
MAGRGEKGHMAREGGTGRADVQAFVILSFSGSYAPKVVISRDLIAASKLSQEVRASNLRAACFTSSCTDVFV